MNFIKRVFNLADQLTKHKASGDKEGLDSVRRRQAILWANASDEDLKSYAPYQANLLSISEEKAFQELKSIRSFHQKELEKKVD